MMRVLIVEDEPDLRQSLARALADEHFAVDTSPDGEDALFRGLQVQYDAIVLDLMLPRRSGEDVLDGLREAGRTTPVILLTARDLTSDRVAGLNRGADDYLTKPFLVEELVARLRALIRRASRHPAPWVTVGSLSVNLAARRVYRDGSEVELTGREYNILELLLRSRGDIVPRTVLNDHLYDDGNELMSNAIDVHIASLRRKLGASLIQTRRGLGYLIDA
jgi:two-component system, OmpR family, response regulator